MPCYAFSDSNSVEPKLPQNKVYVEKNIRIDIICNFPNVAVATNTNICSHLGRHLSSDFFHSKEGQLATGQVKQNIHGVSRDHPNGALIDKVDDRVQLPESLAGRLHLHTQHPGIPSLRKRKTQSHRRDVFLAVPTRTPAEGACDYGRQIRGRALEAESTVNWRSAAYLSRLGLRLWSATTVEEARRRPGGDALDKGSRSVEGQTARQKESRGNEVAVAGSAAAMEATVVRARTRTELEGMCARGFPR